MAYGGVSPKNEPKHGISVLQPPSAYPLTPVIGESPSFPLAFGSSLQIAHGPITLHLASEDPLRPINTPGPRNLQSGGKRKNIYRLCFKDPLPSCHPWLPTSSQRIHHVHTRPRPPVSMLQMLFPSTTQSIQLVMSYSLPSHLALRKTPCSNVGMQYARKQKANRLDEEISLTDCSGEPYPTFLTTRRPLDATERRLTGKKNLVKS